MTSPQPTTSGNVILNLQDVFKSFKVGVNMVEIIKGISFQVKKGEFIVLFGPSGCGKSTVLNILLGLEPPTKGKVTFINKDLYSLSEDERAQLRKEEIGMVYQQSNWVRSLNVIENVCFPLTLRGINKKDREERGWAALKQVEMDHAAYQISSELSSGQQQRVSLARALISDPSLIVADEPTGNLDSKASLEIMELFKSFNQKGKTVVLVTHDLEYLSYANRSIHMTDGMVIDEFQAGDVKLQSLMVSKRGGTSSSPEASNPVGSSIDHSQPDTVPKTEIATVALPTPHVSIESLDSVENSNKTVQQAHEISVDRNDFKSIKNSHHTSSKSSHHNSSNHAPTL